ncbi:hypothetical protein EDB86DRAFT_2949432 [Lactarius hatsudake]|nr:hypothetical protein EDB86DRAFT_2949432 [Lactarius hatsudake]
MRLAETTFRLLLLAHSGQSGWTSYNWRSWTRKEDHVRVQVLLIRTVWKSESSRNSTTAVSSRLTTTSRDGTAFP